MFKPTRNGYNGTMNEQLTNLQTIARRHAGDADALRRHLVLGSTFASFTIRQRTEVAERHFAQWLTAGCPADVRDAGVQATHTDKNRRLAGVLALSDADVLAVYSLPAGDASRYFAHRVTGFGPAKAGFALACSGAPGATACFDSHLLTQYADAVAAAGYDPKQAARKQLKAGPALVDRVWDAYFDLCARVYGALEVSAHAQWEEWLERYGRGTSHGILTTAQEGV